MRRWTTPLIVSASVVGLAAIEPPAGTELQRLVSQAQERPQFRALTNFVEVDASVLDRDRRPIRGLRASDFTVLEDGKPQQVVTFTEIDVPEPVTMPTSWMREIAPDVTTNILASDRRLVVLLLEDGIVGMDVHARRVKEVARRIVDKLGSGDLAAVIFTRDIRKSMDFTSNRSRLLSTIDRYSTGYSGGGGSRNAVEALGKVAEFLAEAPQRRKALIYVSSGWSVDFFAPGNAGAEAAVLKLRMEDAFDKARRANVNFYCIDPSGLSNDAVSGSEGTATQASGAASAAPISPLLAGSLSGPGGLAREFLLTLSSNTGGLSIINNNEFATGVNQIFRENSAYYLIGYQSPNGTADGKLRKIDVRVDIPGATVRARNGYYGSRAENRATPPSPLTAALGGLLQKSDLGMQVAVAPFAVAGKKEVALATILAIRQPPPAELDKTSENVNVLITAFDPLGKRISGQRMTGAITLRAGAGMQIQFEILSQLLLKPGRYQLRIAATSALAGKSGSIYHEVDVPDLSDGRLTLSGVAIETVPSVVASPRDALASLLPIVPTARRDFWQSDQVTAFLRVYQPGRQPAVPVTMLSRVLDATGEAVFVARTTIPAALFGESRAADHRLALSMADFRPGSHVLVIEADAGRDRTARRDVRFELR